MIKSNPCKGCDSTFHTLAFCPYKKRKSIRKEAVNTRIKRMRISDKWFAANPPDKNGYWKCYLNISPDCFINVDRNTINLEHKYSKVRHPELKYDITNIGAACQPCNKMKESKDAIDFQK